MSLHIAASRNEIAPKLLLPGDPLRAKWIAENFLEEAKCYSKIRGMLGFTGLYRGERISVQGSGMGIPSTLIYTHELISEYGVEQIIRVGTAGAYSKNLRLRDIVFAISASTNSATITNLFPNAIYAPTADFNLLLKAVTFAQEQNIAFQAGPVLSSDIFYEEDPQAFEKWASYGVLCVDMETAGIYTIAARHKIKALTILTISDILGTDQKTSRGDREHSFTDMVHIALNSFS